MILKLLDIYVENWIRKLLMLWKLMNYSINSDIILLVLIISSIYAKYVQTKPFSIN